MPEDEITQEQQSNEPAALTKAENPGLFEAVCNQLGINYDSIDRLSPRDQERLYKLDIKAEEGANVTSLNGVEKLKNLRVFSISGLDDCSELFQDIYKKSKNAEDLEQALFVTNQVKDFSPLQKCSHLRSCDIINQRNVQHFDVDNLEELEDLYLSGCDNLMVVSNLTSPMKSGTLKNLHINYSEKFGQIEDEESFVDLLKNGYALDKCKLEHSYFIKLMRCHPELRETMEAMPNDKIQWADTLGEPYSTKQMLMIYDRISDIVNTVCQEGESDVQKLANVYRYFCDTMTYNNSAEEESQDIFDPSVLEVKFTNRRALEVLFNNKGVCAGFSNIFNLCGNYLGFNMETCHCTAKNSNQTYESDYAINSNHAISKAVWYSTKTGEKFEYYFDLTSDLGYYRSDCFMLNRKQILNRNQFCFDEIKNRNDESSPNLLSVLKAKGLLHTSKRNTVVAFTREENPGLFDIACKKLRIDPNKKSSLNPAQLGRIEELNLSSTKKDSNGHTMLWADVRSLEGIEKFHNLRQIRLQGAEEIDINGLIDDNKLQEAQELQDTLSERNQITDLSPLQNCPKLECVYIANQHKLESIDAENLKGIQELHIQECDSLQEIANATELQEKKVDIQDCENLKPIVAENESQTEFAEQTESEQVENHETQQKQVEFTQPVEQNFVEQVQPLEVEQAQSVGDVGQISQPINAEQNWTQMPSAEQPIEQVKAVEYVKPAEQVFVEQPAEFTQNADYVEAPNYSQTTESAVDSYYQDFEQNEPQYAVEKEAPSYENYGYVDPNAYSNQNADQSVAQGDENTPTAIPTAEQMQAVKSGQGASNSVSQEESMERGG